MHYAAIKTINTRAQKRDNAVWHLAEQSRGMVVGAPCSVSAHRAMGRFWDFASAGGTERSVGLAARVNGGAL